MPDLSTNLISVSRCCLDNNCIFVFDADWFSIQDKDSGQTLYRGKSKDGLYPIVAYSLSNIVPASGLSKSSTPLCASVSVSKLLNTELWHFRLGHPSAVVLNKLLAAYDIPCDSKLHTRECISCLKGKMTKLPFALSSTSSNTPLQLVHSDVWGPSPVTSVSGFRYYVSLVDDFSKYTWIFPLVSKSDVSIVVKMFVPFA